MNALRAGAAVFDAGYYHAAHDVWEDAWLDAEGGDAALLQGLIQYAAAVHHARERNWEGCVGLSESARDYLADANPRGVNVPELRTYLAALATDPERVEREPPASIRVDGDRVGFEELSADEALAAAPALADELGDETVELGVEYAREDIAAGDETSVFVRFAIDFVTDPAHRAVIAQRLSEHADRRRRREEDVEGLF